MVARRSVPTSEVLGLHPGGQEPTVSDGVKTTENGEEPLLTPVFS